MMMEAWRKLMPSTVRALPKKILAEMIDKLGQEKKTAGGIIIQDDDANETSIRPRWFKVHSVGDGIDWIEEGQYVMVDHGRWSQGLKVTDELKLHLLDNKDCLAVTDKDPMNDDSIQIGLIQIRQRSASEMRKL